MSGYTLGYIGLGCGIVCVGLFLVALCQAARDDMRETEHWRALREQAQGVAGEAEAFLVDNSIRQRYAAGIPERDEAHARATLYPPTALPVAVTAESERALADAVAQMTAWHAIDQAFDGAGGEGRW